MTETHLQATGISHRFGITEVLQDIHFTLTPGQSLALVGPSGCGKTTLLNILANLLIAERGQLNNSFRETAVMFQESRLLPWRRAAANIGLGLKARGLNSSERQPQVRALAEKLGLDNADLDKFPYELSGGMRQRVALARALVLKPDLLLLDEPFSALDIGLREELQDLLLSEIQRRQMAVVFVTHDLMEAARISDEILLMAPRPGRIIYRHRVSTDKGTRDRRANFEETARLLAQPIVAQTFGVKP